MLRLNGHLWLLVVALGLAVLRAALGAGAPGDECAPGVTGTRVDGALLCVHGDDEPPPGVDTSEKPTLDALWLAA
ncbi:MAG: hypothetical protein ACRDU8_07855, partial [Egibacteraceae bacterium]